MLLRSYAPEIDLDLDLLGAGRDRDEVPFDLLPSTRSERTPVQTPSGFSTEIS